MNNKKIYFLGILSGILLGLSFPPFPFSYLAFAGFVPLIWALEARDNEKVFFMLYSTFFIFHLLTNWWVGSWQPASDPFLMASGVVLAFVHPFFFLVPFYAYLSVRKNYGLDFALWMLPFLWTAFEWLHSLGDLSYPWLNIGYSQAYNYIWPQFADIAGVWGVSFLLLMINSLIARLLFVYVKSKNTASGISPFKIKKLKKLVFIILVLILLPYIYGAYIITKYNHAHLIETHKTMNIAVVQPNINPWVKWESGVHDQMRLHLNIQDSLLNTGQNPDIFIWSETAIPFYDFSLNSNYNFGIIQDWVSKHKIPIISGFAEYKLFTPKDIKPQDSRKFKNSELFYTAYNAVALISSERTDSVQIYRKMKLTPFSEQIPFSDALPFLQGWIEWGVGISSWKKGPEQHTINFLHVDNTVKIGVIICIESIYPDFVQNFSRLRADFLVVITNDAWYDHTFGPEQHFIISQFRAIESRKYLARCANSGISGFITPTGKRMNMLPQYNASAGMSKIALLSGKSIYAVLGDWLPYLAAILSFIVLLYAFIKNKFVK